MDPEALEIGAVYRDPGGAGAPAVDFIIGRFDDETTEEDAPVLRVAHLQIGPAGGGDGVVMSHAPVERATAAAAATERVGTADVAPAFGEGYAAWREAYDKGEAGVFSLSPAEIYAQIVAMMARRGS